MIFFKRNFDSLSNLREKNEIYTHSRTKHLGVNEITDESTEKWMQK